MASRFGYKRVQKRQEASDYLLGDPRRAPLNELSHSAPWWTEREERRDQENSLREQLKEMAEHVARLQDMLKSERTKITRLQLRCSHQEAELKRREQLCTRAKERLSQLTDRQRDKAPAIDVLNFLPGGRGKRDHPVRSLRSAAKHEEASLRLMLERREAELREEMRMRHSLTSFLRSLRVDMDQTLKNVAEIQDAAPEDETAALDQAEGLLGEQVTGGVIQSWRRLQKRLGEGHDVVGTDHHKLLIQLEAELKESHQLVRLQQQLLQDAVSSPLPSELADSYFLEEWERLQVQLVELENQRRAFEKERQRFTDAAVRLSHERRDFEQQKASLVKQQYLCDSPAFAQGLAGSNRRESTALSLGSANLSGCVPITPSSTESGAGVRIQTPSTPELYSALNLTYHCRPRDADHQLEAWDEAAERKHTPRAPHLDWSL